MGDGNLSPNRRGRSRRALPARATARSRSPTSTGRRRCSANIGQSRRVERHGRSLRRLHPAARARRAAGGRLPGRRQEAPHLGLPQGAHAARAGDLVHGRRHVHAPVEGPAGADRGRQRTDRDLRRRDEPGLARAAGRLPPRHARPRRQGQQPWCSPAAGAAVHDRGERAVPGHRSRRTSTRRWPTSCCRGSRASSAVEPQFVEPVRASGAGARPRRPREAEDAVDAPLRHPGRGQPQLLRRRRHGAQQPGDDDRRKGAEVLRVGAPRYPSNRDAEGRPGGGWKPDSASRSSRTRCRRRSARQRFDILLQHTASAARAG